MDEYIVPLDGSEISGKVVDYAASEAKTHGAKVVLMHVVPHLTLPPEFREYAARERLDTPRLEYLHTIGREILSKFAQKLTDADVKNETLVESGHPPERILKVAELRNAALIIMGFVGFHGLDRIRALGSVSRKVMEESKRPVLIVPA